MNKIVFACDIDNTLLRSWRCKQEDDICVEYIHGQAQSYISPKLLKALNDVSDYFYLLPVTTRSIRQFQRIEWRKLYPIKTSIVANGGVILGMTKLNRLWRLSVEQLYKNAQPIFNKIIGMCNDFALDYRMIDESYLRILIEDSKDDSLSLWIAKEFSDQIYTFRDNKKRYVLPKSISKGHALDFVLKNSNYDILIVAGDNDADISMLNLADIAIVPNLEIRDKLDMNRTVYCGQGKDFMDFLTDTIAKMNFENFIYNEETELSYQNIL